jgi:hypothetical protein
MEKFPEGTRQPVPQPPRTHVMSHVYLLSGQGRVRGHQYCIFACDLSYLTSIMPKDSRLISQDLAIDNIEFSCAAASTRTLWNLELSTTNQIASEATTATICYTAIVASRSCCLRLLTEVESPSRWTTLLIFDRESAFLEGV